MDTLRSTATLTAEETQSLTIAEDTLTSTEHYATTKDGAGETGTYTPTGTHANLFTIANDGAITSNGTINKGTYSFNVNYTDGAGATHVEAVTLNVTEAFNRHQHCQPPRQILWALTRVQCLILPALLQGTAEALTFH